MSTDDQATCGLGLEAQSETVRSLAAARGYEVVAEINDAGVTGAVAPPLRPCMGEALRLLEGGAADVLVVAKIDRVSRSTIDLSKLASQADDVGYELVSACSTIDTTLATGRFTFTVLAAVSDMERGLIRERTKAALQAKKAQGFRLGRPVTTPDAIRRRAGTEWTKAGAQRLLRGFALDEFAAAHS